MAIITRREFLVNILRFFVAYEYPRETGELTIQIPALPRPTLKDIQKKYPWVKSIERDTSPEGPVTLQLATVLRPGENVIGGTEYERRLAPSQDVSLGYQQWQWLLEHQDEYPVFMALLGKVYIDFPGIVVVHEGGDRGVPYCGQYCTRWRDGWHWLNRFFLFDRIAVANK